jgi:hypothetical protein
MKMITLKRGIPLLLILILMFSCKNIKNQYPLSTKEINFIPGEVTDIYLETSIDTFYFLPLGVNKDFVMSTSNINKILFTADNIIVADNNSLFIFNRKGEPLKKISSKGKGPGEYIEIDDVFLDKDKMQFEILDFFGNKILIYDFDGAFVNEKKIDKKLSGYQFTRYKGLYVFDRRQFSLDGKRLGLFDTDLNYIKSYLPIPESVLNLGLSNQFSFGQYNDTLFYLVPMMDVKIYSITKDTIIPVYELEYPGKNLEEFNTKEKLNKLMRYSSFISQSSQIYCLSHLTINKDFISFKGCYKGQNLNIIYAKRSGHVFQYSEVKSIENDKLRILGEIRGVDGDFFALPITESINKFLPDNIKMRLDENANPVLLLFKFRDF